MTNLSFNDLVDLSVNYDGDNLEVDCSLTLNVKGIDLQAHACSVSNRDLLFYCNEGTVTYLVDVYNGTARAELYDWTLDDGGHA